MISVIICSRTPEISIEQRTNIQNSIGIEHEVITIDNSRNQYSIFTAYNMGVQQSRFPYLCFVHDDVLFHSTNWGVKVCEHFKDETAGILGISGTIYLPCMPGTWWRGGLINEAIIPDTSQDMQPRFKYTRPATDNRNEVVSIDGVLMLIKRSLFDLIRFDDSTYTGYHLYDVDICLQTRKLGYKIYCIYDVFIQHLSRGSLNKAWLTNTLVCHQKWAAELPAACSPVGYSKSCWIEFKTLDEYLEIALHNGVPKKELYQLIWKMLFSNLKIYRYYRTPFYIAGLFKKVIRHSYNQG